jgi:alpha-2-macroglobulin
MGVMGVFVRCIAWLLSLMGLLVGVWSAPPWLRWICARLTALGALLWRSVRASPKWAVLVLLMLMAGGWGAKQGWMWWKARPVPVEVAVSASNPVLPNFALGASAPWSAVAVQFTHAVAPLASTDKIVATGLTMEPVMAGTWKWVNDRRLSFEPKGHWPTGVQYTVNMQRSMFVPQARMKSLVFGFQTPAFEPKVAKSEFYQDPVNPNLKKAVFEFDFTHPVNTVEFEKRLELRMAGQAEGVMGVGRQTTPFTVTYDALKLHAFVHSGNLAIPKEDTSITLNLDEGTAAQLGGVASKTKLNPSVTVPGLYGLKVGDASIKVVTNERFEPEQVLMLETSQTVHEAEFAKQVSVWVLPKYKPDTPKAEQGEQGYAWSDSSEVTDTVLAKSTKLALAPVASESEDSNLHSFKLRSDVGRVLWVRVEPKAKSFGGYLMPERDQRLLVVPPYPPELRILSQGALLPLSGEKKVAVLVRDLPGIKIEVGRVQPTQLQHLVSQSKGEFASPTFLNSFGPDNLTDRFEKSVPLSKMKPGKAHYESIDLSEYLAKEGELRRGLFFLNIKGYDPKTQSKEPVAAEPQETDEGSVDDPVNRGENEGENIDPGSMVERRLVLVTDLGLVVKKSPDGSRDVFVQSLFTGAPVVDAKIEVVARNGNTLVALNTDTNGRAHFDKLDGFSRERAPLLVTARKGSDMSFMPLERKDRQLDMSRFDVGGVQNALSQDQLSAHVFSDRGIYRPGETMHLGLIVKAADWRKSLVGLPLEAEVLDARGLVVKRERLRLVAGGFAEVNHTTLASSPTGNYTVNVNMVKDDKAERNIGSTVVKVQEFMPDTMKVVAQLSSPETKGWVHPDNLKGNINAQNLFGTPAENRKVELAMNLNPALPAFRNHPDFAFFDPQKAAQRTNDSLPEGLTDAKGELEVDLKLSRFAKATYRLSLLAKVFEPGSGRSVSAETNALVSELPYLVGVKHDGDLNFVSMGSKRISQLLAIDPQTRPLAVPDLRVQFVERKTVSVLMKQANETFKYESRKKDVVLSDTALALTAQVHPLTLDTQKAGNYSYVLRNADGLELNRVDYSVAGTGNVSRSLERNAELQLSLGKTDYAAGEDIEISIRAPYVGAGLITIERDKVFTQQWFKTTTTSSVQKIKLPADFEGNGYVSVQFVRDPASDEIFMSPMSYGVVPFATSLASRTQALKLTAPELTKPGQVLKMKLSSKQPTRAVVFAVDEGILQVARYQTPNPLAHFFQKRALEIKTSQILDLLLPEFKRLMAQSAPGGDQEGANARFLNPFKRRTESPAVYWSGIVDVAGEREFSFTVPDHFNGNLRLMAVSVNEGTVGVAQSKALVRGDFVMSPNMPLAVAPGDEFEVSVGVSNNVKGSPRDAPVQLELKAAATFDVVGKPIQSLSISPMREQVATYRLRVKDSAQATLGSSSLEFTSSLGDKVSKRRMDISVRPLTPRVTTVNLGSFTGATEIVVARDLVPEFRRQDIALSVLPLAMAPSLINYLDNFPHYCTEQLVSRILPMLVLTKRPEFGVSTPQATAKTFDEALRVLRTRQNAEGGFGLWGASVEADEFASVYAVHMLMEARELEIPGVVVPGDMLRKGLEYAQKIAATHPQDLGQARIRAYAIYLLTRSGLVTTPLVSSLREALDGKFAKVWLQDSTAAYLAATYQLLKQDKPANELMKGLLAHIETPNPQAPYQWTPYYDLLVRDTKTLYLLARHFPERLRAMPPNTITRLVQPLTDGRFNTLSSSFALISFEAMARTLGVQAMGKLSVVQINAQGAATPLPLPENLVPKAAVQHGTTKLKLGNDTPLTTYYGLTQSGFDRNPPKEVLTAGMEVVREIMDKNGKLLNEAKLGEEVTVKLSLRALPGMGTTHNVALTDLLPGGFEVVQGRGDDGTQNTVQGAGLQYFDVREDRVVLYASAQSSEQTFTYKMRATNSGQFTVPPAFAESMYEREKMARSLGYRITVGAPAPALAIPVAASSASEVK